MLYQDTVRRYRGDWKTRELGPIRSKPDGIDQPERTDHYDCAMCIVEMLHNTISTETVLLIFRFLQTNITVQVRPSGG